jgi:hypothetical protein
MRGRSVGDRRRLWTVRTQLRHVFAKLDVPNRAALAGLLNRLEATAKVDHDAGH